MQLSRRDFIGAGSLALAGCCAPCAGRTYVSEPVEILRTARLRNRGERLRMAFIGSGGRGGANLDAFYSLGEEVVALCDLDWTYAKRTFDLFPGARLYKDYREMLRTEADKADAIYCGCPDHWHTLVTLAALPVDLFFSFGAERIVKLLK